MAFACPKKMLTRLLTVSIKVNVGTGTASLAGTVGVQNMTFWDWLMGGGRASTGGKG
jgi:hypothetical protein